MASLPVPTTSSCSSPLKGGTYWRGPHVQVTVMRKNSNPEQSRSMINFLNLNEKNAHAVHKIRDRHETEQELLAQADYTLAVLTSATQASTP